MPWPLSQDYNEAIQNPAQSFADPELRQGEADTNELGLPAPRSGNFADVYAVASGANKWAVKCFTRQIPGLQERYQQISVHLAQYKPSFMVNFSFLEQGIRVRGDWYPILKMQWVEGATLNQFVKSNLHKPQLLDVLCQLWVKLSVRLRRVNIAHCDLQHGNVLMVPGSKAKELQVKLVDYDGMCVPALTLLKSIEVGHPAYQHPQRQREGIYNLEVDRFSHLVIFTALKALTTGGKELWDKYDDGDNLLFKPADFAAPTKSRLLYELLKSQSPEVAGLARVLVQAATESLDKAPLLEQLTPALARQSAVSVGTSAAKANGQEHAPAQRQPIPRKKALMVPLAAGIALILGLVTGAAFFLFRGDTDTSSSGGMVAQKNIAADPAGKPIVRPQPTVVDQKNQKKATASESPAKTVPQPSKADGPAPRPSPPETVDKPDNAPKNPTPPQLTPPAPKKTTNPKPMDPTPPTPAEAKRPPVKPMEPSQGPPQKSSPQPAPAAHADGPRPVPAEPELAAALDKVKDQYKDEWSARKTKELEDLATRLFRQGQKTTNEPPLQFVLLRQARDKAADAADAELAMQVVDEMAKYFTLNLLEEKVAALERSDHAAVGAASIKSVVDTSIDVVKQAASDDNYDIALRLLKAAALSAARSGNRSLQSSVRSCSDEVHALRKEYDKVKMDLEKLAVDPNDAAANLAVGRYCCFRKKDWEKGLPYLAKGSDPQLADLANLELKEADSSAAWVKLGDGWRKFADKADGPAKAAARRKAYAWYAQAYPELPEAEAARVEKSMAKLAKEVPGLRRPWEGLDISQAVDKKTYLVLEPGKSISTRRQYTGPLLISATVRADHHSLMIRAFGDGFMEFRETGLQQMLQLSLPDPDPLKRLNNTMNYGARSPFVPLTRHMVQWRITESGMEVLMDGRVVFRVERDLNLSRRGPIVITSRDATVEVLSLHVTPLK